MGRKLIDLTGQRFGKLVVIRRANNRKTNICYLCRCDCGTEAESEASNLRRGCATQCYLCRSRQNAKKAKIMNTTHGHTCQGRPSRTYCSWNNMLQRCGNQLNRDWRKYGGNGRTVCDRWLKFENFLADMGPRPEGTSLGRFTDLGNYEPMNCIWMTMPEQIAERKKKNFVFRVIKQHAVLEEAAAETREN